MDTDSGDSYQPSDWSENESDVDIPSDGLDVGKVCTPAVFW